MRKGRVKKINSSITALRIRLISKDGQQIGIMTRTEALEQAEQKDLDLVEVVSVDQEGIVVCKLMDYNKQQYKMQKSMHKNGHVTKLKEVRLNSEIGDRDLETKIKQMRKFIEHKDRVKVTFMYKGRNASMTQSGHDILQLVERKLGDIARVDGTPTQAGYHTVIHFVIK